jgi:hypothetical protein
MSYYKPVDYETSNKSDRDITKNFDIKQFNTNFEDNDKELQSNLNEEYKKQIDTLTDTCQNNYKSIHYYNGIILIISGVTLLFISILIYSNRSKKNSS